MEPIYKIDGLSKTYKNGNVPANIDLNLEIRPGEIFGIFGPNGAGKTTLVRQMAGLIKPSSGSILLNGIDVVRHPAQIPYYVSYFAQAPWILWSLKVWETIYFTGIFRGMAKKEARRQTDRLLADFGLEDIRNRLMETLSGGQSKLLGLAAALIGDRPVLILDEPTNELDPINRLKVWELLARLCRDLHRTVVLVTHNVLEAEQVVDRVIMVDGGKIIACGTPGELKAGVDDRVRIEISFKPGTLLCDMAPLRAFEHHFQLQKYKWQVFIPKPEAAAVYQRLMGQIDMEKLDDFRLITTTLEDVYIQLGGSSRETFNV